jgi:hypothetical protein
MLTEAGTIGALGVDDTVACKVSYLIFLSSFKLPDNSFANSLNFISFNDLPPIISSNKS